MKWIVVGDPHATLEELGDCEKLIDHVIAVAEQEHVDKVLFLGDLYHTHAIIHVEVMAFWKRSFARLKAAGLQVDVLVGNHDRPGNEASESHSLMSHDDSDVRVFSRPQLLFEGLVFVPYMSSREEFVKACHQLADMAPGHPQTLVCHQTFNGAAYENGFYAKDGIDPESIPQQYVVSGHIHAPQEFGKVWYPGSPRWRTLSDANTERAIWVVDLLEPRDRKAHSMTGVCRDIRHIVVMPEGLDDVPDLTQGTTWHIDVRGPRAFVDAHAASFKGPGRRVRTFVTDAIQTTSVRESDGIEKAFFSFAAKFPSRFGTAPERLSEMAKERLGWHG